MGHHLPMTEITKTPVLDFARWEAEFPALREQYARSEPFPHLILDNFLIDRAAESALADFPPINSDQWTNYVHVNERKYGKNDWQSFTPDIKAVIEELHSREFVQLLSEMSGIDGLFTDAQLEGGGLHQSGRDGFLNIHADFTTHPHHRTWRRRINLLVYLNKDWEEVYGGHLELWDRSMTRCVKRISPVFNRCVIFKTDSDSFHGHPDKLKCPEHMTRKSIALYYFTEHTDRILIRSTEYRARPGDGVKALWIGLDKIVLRVYDRLKRRLGLSDRFASQTLAFLQAVKDKITSPFKKGD